MALHKLTARFVETVKEPGLYSDGGGLYLQVVMTKNGRLSKSYVFIFHPHGRRREGGLGATWKVSLADARGVAAEWRSMIARGVDPIEQRKALREARKSSKTFEECAAALFKSKSEGWSKVHKDQWQSSISTYCAPVLKRDVALVDRRAVLSVLTPLWARAPETAKRVMSRIDAVIGFATAHGYREGDSPAKWKNGLDAVFTADRERTHFRAMAYSDLPGFLTDLRKKEGVGAAALEFLVLTASRLTEARGAAWGEINLETKTWTIPAARMKAGQEHKVPLSSRAVEILTSQKRQNGFVFAGYRIGKPIGPEALRDLVPDGATIHGMRSSFADWAAEQTRFSHEDIEVCLAHTIGNVTSRAYRRTDLLERRRDIMESWSNYVTGATSAKVIAIGGKAAKHP